MINNGQQKHTSVLGRWDLIPSEVLDLLFESGIPRDVSCDLIDSLPDDLWPQIQLITVKLNPREAKVCTSNTLILAYLMQHDFKLPENIDVQVGSAFHFLQEKMAELRISGHTHDIDMVKSRLDEVVIHFIGEFYQKDYIESIYSAANEPIH